MLLLDGDPRPIDFRCTHNVRGSRGGWWLVDIGGPHRVQRVTLTNREHCCGLFSFRTYKWTCNVYLSTGAKSFSFLGQLEFNFVSITISVRYEMFHVEVSIYKEKNVNNTRGLCLIGSIFDFLSLYFMRFCEFMTALVFCVTVFWTKSSSRCNSQGWTMVH